MPQPTAYQSGLSAAGTAPRQDGTAISLPVTAPLGELKISIAASLPFDGIFCLPHGQRCHAVRQLRHRQVRENAKVHELVSASSISLQ